jgi:hypothetical protein
MGVGSSLGLFHHAHNPWTGLMMNIEVRARGKNPRALATIHTPAWLHYVFGIDGAQALVPAARQHVDLFAWMPTLMCDIRATPYVSAIYKSPSHEPIQPQDVTEAMAALRQAAKDTPFTVPLLGRVGVTFVAEGAA